MGIVGKLKSLQGLFLHAPTWAKAWIFLVLFILSAYFWLSTPTDNPYFTSQEVALFFPGTEDSPSDSERAKDQKKRPFRPAEEYAATPQGTHDDYRISVIITDLGTNLQLLQTANGQLPPQVDFALRPETPNLSQVITMLRMKGREVLLMVPMEPDGYPHNDPGLKPLLVGLPTEENLNRIALHTEKAEGIIGVAPLMGEAFTRSRIASEPIASWLSKNGYAIFDISLEQRRSQFIEAALAYGGLYLDNPVRLTEALADERMKLIKFEYMETVAEREGLSIGVIEGSPKVIPLLNEWFQTFPDKKLVLTPASSSYLPDPENSQRAQFNSENQDKDSPQLQPLAETQGEKESQTSQQLSVKDPATVTPETQENTLNQDNLTDQADATLSTNMTQKVNTTSKQKATPPSQTAKIPKPPARESILAPKQPKETKDGKITS